MEQKEEYLTKESDEFGTPDEIFEELHRRYQFTVDAAASKENAKLPVFITKEENALKCGFVGDRVWCNPPYSNGNCKKFALHFFEATANGCQVAVLLVPTKTEQAWFHTLLHSGRVEVHFFRRRINFLGGKHTARDSHMLLVIWPPTHLF